MFLNVHPTSLVIVLCATLGSFALLFERLFLDPSFSMPFLQMVGFTTSWDIQGDGDRSRMKKMLILLEPGREICLLRSFANQLMRPMLGSSVTACVGFEIEALFVAGFAP